MKELLRKSSILKQYFGKDAKRYVSMETNTDCNRKCPECSIPESYNKDNELTLAQTKSQIDWLYREGFRILSYVGGEPLSPLRTKEGITFLEHTTETIRYASAKGITSNVTTNGDYVNEDIVRTLKSAGLDSLTFSLHSLEEKKLLHLINGAKIAGKMGIVPAIHALLTSGNVEMLPEIAFRVAENGVLFSINIVQEKGKGFSTAPQQSQMPTAEQAKKAFNPLLKLKSRGFVLTDKNYLANAPNHIKNAWKCNPNIDFFIHIGAGGFLNICSENRTQIKTTDINLSDSKWREKKQELVKNCEGCNYQCWQRAENPDLIRDIPTIVVVGLIKSGNAKLVERLGKFATKGLRFQL